jgi:hypothetical protein
MGYDEHNFEIDMDDIKLILQGKRIVLAEWDDEKITLEMKSDIIDDEE